MRTTLALWLLILGLSGSPVVAQHASKEAEIRQAVPYWQLRREIPTLTLQDYNEAVRDLAQELSVPQATPPPRIYRPPTYSYTPKAYTPPSYTLPQRPTYPPQTGTSYDWRSGSVYNWNRRADGSTDVFGSNVRTGSFWSQTIQPDGSMSGIDKGGNFWTYDDSSTTYMNLGTGQLCVGEGAGRVCTR